MFCGPSRGRLVAVRDHRAGKWLARSASAWRGGGGRCARTGTPPVDNGLRRRRWCWLARGRSRRRRGTFGRWAWPRPRGCGQARTHTRSAADAHNAGRSLRVVTGGRRVADRVGRTRERLRAHVRARTGRQRSDRGNVSATVAAAMRLESRAHSHRDDHSRCVHGPRIVFPTVFHIASLLARQHRTT